MTAVEPLTHVRLDPAGTAWIDDTNVKVIEVAVDYLAHHSTPEQIQAQYPHLSLAQVYAALAYYHDHKKVFDAQIEQDLREVSALRETAGPPPKLDELRALKRRP